MSADATALSHAEAMSRLDCIPLGSKLTIHGFTAVGSFQDTGFLVLNEGAFHLARDRRGTQLVPLFQEGVQYTEFVVRESSRAPNDRIRSFDSERAQQQRREQPIVTPVAHVPSQVPDNSPATPQATLNQASLLQLLQGALANLPAATQLPTAPQVSVETLNKLVTGIKSTGNLILSEENGTPTLSVAPFRPALLPFALWSYPHDAPHQATVAAWKADVARSRSDLGVYLMVPPGLSGEGHKKATAAIEANLAGLRFAELFAAHHLEVLLTSPRPKDKKSWYPSVAAGIALLSAMATAKRTFVEAGGKVLERFEEQWLAGTINLEKIYEDCFRK